MRIAIVGDGICGLSLALNLHRHGIFCRVYERAPRSRNWGSGSPSCRTRFVSLTRSAFTPAKAVS